MEFSRPLCLLLVLLTIVSSSHAYKFYVGGSGGWVPNPSESYSQWAGRNRFKINDTLVFKYQKGSDSVLEVKKEDYDKCNKTKPIKKFEDGNTEFTLDRSGPFYFISGKDQNCEKGQKLNVVVLTPRGPTPPPPPPPKPSPTPSPSGSPPAPAPTPSGQPPSSSPVVSPTPASGPSPATSPAPAGKSPSPSPALSPGPVSGPPASSPASSPSPAGKSPSPSPAAGSPGPVSGPPAPSPATPSPAGTTPSPSAGSPPGTTPSPSAGSTPSPGGAKTPSSNVATPPGNEGWAAAPSSLLVYSVTIVVGAVLLR